MEILEWEDGFKLGDSVIRMLPMKIQPYTIDSFISIDLDCGYETIVLNCYVYAAPCNVEYALEKIKRHNWKYCTRKDYSGAVVFLGSK